MNKTLKMAQVSGHMFVPPGEKQLKELGLEGRCSCTQFGPLEHKL